MRHGLALRSSKYCVLHNATRKNSSSSYHQLKNHHPARPLLSPSIILASFHSRKIHIQPLPVPALAIYDFDACDFRDEMGSLNHQDVEDQVHRASHSHEHYAILAPVSAATGAAGSGSGGKSSVVGNGGGYDVVANGSSNRFVRRTSGGGSGSGTGGTHQCPKCGAHVTFHEPNASSSNNSIAGNHNNNNNSEDGSATQNNHCFYCAACSGWFLIPQNSNSTNDDDVSTAQSKYLMSKLALASSGTGAGGGGEDNNKATGFPTTPSNRKIPQSQFVMQHVSVCFGCSPTVMMLYYNYINKIMCFYLTDSGSIHLPSQRQQWRQN